MAVAEAEGSESDEGPGSLLSGGMACNLPSPLLPIALRNDFEAQLPSTWPVNACVYSSSACVLMQPGMFQDCSKP